jgi:hypothetical protein
LRDLFTCVANPFFLKISNNPKKGNPIGNITLKKPADLIFKGFQRSLMNFSWLAHRVLVPTSIVGVERRTRAP